MSKILIANLSIFLTDNCNFKCMHCMCGEQIGIEIKRQALDSLFNQAQYIANLTLCGGEPFSRPDLLNMLIDMIIEKNVTINEFGIITNGTLYTQEIESILDRLNEYATTCPKLIEISGTRGHLLLSSDYYHQLELSNIKNNNPDLFKQYCENLEFLRHSKFFEGKADLTGIFNLGNARNLKLKKLNHKKMPKIYYQKKDTIYFGPLLSMLDDGTISECDGPLEELKRKYNYGNITSEPLEDIIKRMSSRVYTIQSFNKKKDKIIRWYETYH